MVLSSYIFLSAPPSKASMAAARCLSTTGPPVRRRMLDGAKSNAEVAAAAAAAAAAAVAMNHPLFGGEVDPLFYSNCCEFASVNATFLRYVCVYVSPSVGLSTAVSKHTLDDLRAASSRRPSLPSPASPTCTHE